MQKICFKFDEDTRSRPITCNSVFQRADQVIDTERSENGHPQRTGTFNTLDKTMGVIIHDGLAMVEDSFETETRRDNNIIEEFVNRSQK